MILDSPFISGSMSFGIANPSATMHISASTGDVLRVDGAGATNTGSLFVSSSGNVGIGTLSASAKLDVKGSAVFGSGTVPSYIALGNNGDSFATRFSVLSTDTHGNFSFGSNLALDNARQLYTINNHANLRGAAIVLGGNNYTLGSNTIAFFAETAGTATANTVVSASSADMVIQAGGNVGIGTTSPSARLDVTQLGGTSSNNALFLRAGNNSNTSGSNQILFGFDASVNYAHAIKTRHQAANAIENGIDFYTWRFGDAITTPAGRYVMTIAGNGSVGIGKTSPNATFDVSGSALISGSINATGPITGSSFTTTGTITAQTLIVQTISSSLEFVTGSTKFGSLAANTHQFTGSLQITGSGPHHILGNIGVGVTNPISQFHISGSTGGTFTDGLRINRNGNANQYTVINHVGGASNFISVDTSGNNIAEMYFQRSINGTAATSSMMINTNGNVGIGISSPVGKLNIWPADNSVAVLRGNAGVSTSVPAFEFFSHNSSATQGGLAINTFDTTSQERLRITYDGLVGIRTSTPTEIFNVNVGTGARAGMALTGEYPYLRFNVTSSSANARNWALNATNAEPGDFAILQSNARDGNPVTAGTSILGFSRSGAATFVGTVATTGVVFPATQVASADPNTLDDYEEGTWTPAFAQAGTPSYTTQFGRYTRIGNMVYCTIALRATSISGGSTIQITGLPFTPGDASDTGQRATYNPRLGGHINGLTETTAKFRITGGTTMEGVKGDGDTTFMTAAQFTSGGSVQLTGQFWYYV